tara:strand:- start:1675 stop:2073 length:399 start_codon:yes stop_codon:yes gene_type:complete
MLKALQTFYCCPGVSTKNKTKVGLIAMRNIPSNTKVLERPQYHGQWCYTSELHDKVKINSKTLYTLQDLYKNKKLFMQDSNRTYTFVPTIPLHEFHGEMFLNQSKINANVVSKKDGYFTFKDVKEGEELLLL